MVTALTPATKRPMGKTPKQLFIENYRGDIVSAALAAGTTKRACRMWLRDYKVREAIERRGVVHPSVQRFIAQREDRLEFWTEVMTSKFEPMDLRLRASELLGKAEGDFIERKIITGADGGPVQMMNLNMNASMPVSELEERVRKLRGTVQVAEEMELLA